MDALSFLSGVAMTMGALLTVLNIREKLWPKPPKPHPLQPVLIDIARAIRERQATISEFQGELEILAQRHRERQPPP